ncbi:hypothetical protein PPACK8108_LOCUS23924 [Phakopsora pachyrhizi]|uniref:Uncharacterized protein n=1 Tax=Phakopsora pachyrhizi TaxID=170000 RepID=A0AAV0BRE3_PHAPC|nr:hypothetical protein PPACK8108_LOCUS23924 [Phakopsora pachyrhizi]
MQAEYLEEHSQADIKSRLSRLIPLIAEPILRQNHQVVSNNIFTNNPKDSKHETEQNFQQEKLKITSTRPNLNLFDQFPFFIPRLVQVSVIHQLVITWRITTTIITLVWIITQRKLQSQSGGAP